MARKQSRVPKPISLKTADDLRLIRGVGPVLADRIQNAGICTYNQLASLSPADLAARVIGLSAKQITRQDWIGQARKLDHKRKRSKGHKKETARHPPRQHYENFTIELLLDATNEARRTRVVHIQSGDADTWVGWEAERLTNFLARHTGIHIPTAKLAPKEIEVSRKKASQTFVGESSSKLIPISQPVLPVSTKVDLALPITELAERIMSSPAAVDLTGTLRLQELMVMPIDSYMPVSFLGQGQPYLVRLTLDLAEVFVPNDTPLVYIATVVFKQLGGPRYPVRETGNAQNLSEIATMDMVGIRLPQGIYRLNASVSLSSDEATPGLTAFLRGDLLHVH